MTTDGTIVRISINGSEYRVTSRIAKMMKFLAESKELSMLDNVQVVFDCAGTTVSAEVKRRQRI